MAGRIRDMNWTGHPLGPPEGWPQALRFALNLALASSFPMAVYWGPQLHLFYNDAWRFIPADRHPWALGRPGREVWADIWDVVGPQFDAAMRDGTPFASFDQLLMMERDGTPTETYWNYSGTPIRDEYGTVVGILNQGNETTRLVLAERDRRAESERLRELFQQSPGAVALLTGPEHVLELANDTYLQLVGRRDIVGQPIAVALPEVVAQGFVDLLDNVRSTGKTYRAWAAPIMLARAGDGVLEERLLDYVYQPIRDASGAVQSIFVEANDVTEQAVAERALRESEARLQLALQASQGVGIWDWDVVNDRVTADAGFARLYGTPEDAAVQGAPITNFFNAIHPDDAERVRAAIDHTLLTGDAFAEEYRLVQPDGSVRWVAAQGRAMRDEHGAMARFPGVTFDITNRKQAEDAARAAAEELRAATETQAFVYSLAERQRALETPQAIMRFTAAALGRRLDVDRVGFYRVSGDRVEYGPCWTGGALPPMRGSRAVDEIGEAHVARYRSGRTLVFADARRDPTFAGSSIATVTTSGIGVPLLRGGEWVASMYVNHGTARDWSDEEVSFVEAVAEISWDAVERVVATAALRESEAKFRAIANSIDHMVWSARADGRFDYFNDRWMTFVGPLDLPREGDGWLGALHPDDRDAARAAWHASLTTGASFRCEYRLTHAPSHGYRWVLAQAKAVREPDGSISRWFGTCTDIQEIVDAREVLTRSREELERAVEERTAQLMAAEEQLRQAQKMEAVGQLTGGIAHDFNNMLAVVIGALDLLERRLKAGSHDVDRYVLAARDGATRAAGLTQRLLSFARQTPLAPRPVDADQMVLGMLDLLNRTIGDHITVSTELRGGGASAIADPSQLENVVLNLAVNARDAMPGGGTLTIRTARIGLDAPAAARFGITPGDYVRLSVTDTGAGMSPEVAARAFEPFFTTKGVGKGTGLGLSQVFGFVRQSGGHVEIASRPDEGTSVHVYLPAGGDPAIADRATLEAAEAPRARAGETILVVEDEERLRNFSVEALRDLGYVVSHAATGRAALELIDAGQRPTLLFTDVVMPEMAGTQLAAEARRRMPDLPVLFTSGYTRDVAPADVAELHEALLPKPFDLNQLAERVRAAIDGAAHAVDAGHGAR
ncbi:PAS domain-containing protein [Sphingomonas baiyangensis]|uniref:histidine kinase n=1 Tax=Sphingomonas baiyangensis TaxID=2572576 RepID=A0A4U1L486_9SPHN|nr:PAS domain-containing protein [Sphingomonas baiyangensis]TKD51314.1 PAS domain S-box protein [Sphingomonas baiyangensis]